MTMAARSEEAQFVTFALGEEVFAVPVEVVREILDHEELFKIPNRSLTSLLIWPPRKYATKDHSQVNKKQQSTASARRSSWVEIVE